MSAFDFIISKNHRAIYRGTEENVLVAECCCLSEK